MPHMDASTAYTELLCRCKEANTLSSCAGVLGWDERTHMPRLGSAHRGEQMALLARLAHEQLTAPVLADLLSTVEGAELPDDAKANVREIRRVRNRAAKVP